MQPQRRWSALVSAAALLALSACGAQDRAVVVLAASSIAPAIEAAADDLGLPVAVVGAGSQVLVAQVEAGAPADLVLLAEPELAARLVALGLPEPVRLTSTTLSLVARPGLTTSFDTALDDGALSIVLADEPVPLGAASRAALRRLGEQRLADVLARTVSFEDAASSVLAKVEAGEADLAIVYTANAGSAAAAGRIQVLGAFDDQVVVDVLAQAATPAGRAFLELLQGDAAQRILRDFGFTTFA